MKAHRSFSTDVAMRNLWHWLVRDFRSLLDDPSFLRDREPFLSDMATFRALGSGERYFLSPYTYFKCRYQMENLFKRYIFTKDVYKSTDLEEMAKEKFLATQIRIAGKPPVTHRAFLIIQKARTICREILGDYSVDEHYLLCRFGKKASVGVRASEAYLDRRLELPLSGSYPHIKWFEKHLTSDKLLEGAICDSQKTDRPNYVVCESLALTNVPKSYKSLRSIMPNTTIGGFYSYGLGKLIEDRLTSVGLNIKRLQEKHRRLARLFSRTRTHTTADLSAASDSFTADLLNRVLPRPWYNAMKYGRIRHVEIDGTKNYLMSFMTMGVGFTFQAQTLVFYSLLKAIQTLSKAQGLISVYGDDLIYPSRMHHFVAQFFTDIGFLLNDDKTYVKESFRESCGGDYYCGFDVRPFQPEGQAQLLARQEYSVFLYKTINGLLRRWSEDEIPQSLGFLYKEILRVDDVILQVPPSFPDYSGVRVDRPRKDFLFPWAEVENVPVTGVPLHGESVTTYSLRFAFYKLDARDRKVAFQLPYLWLKLRYGSDVQFDPTIDTSFHYESSERDILRWVRTKVPSKNYRSPITRRRLRKLHAVQDDVGRSSVVIRQTGTTCRWN